ncbi:hypothetical protein Scep_025514 [Stephania cephalantha]|uniref:Uncharacterized protein n=1 Tax=Stephania cephalantha TaxID=152367 RepID=A0AAP0EID0_9MAGN
MHGDVSGDVEVTDLPRSLGDVTISDDFATKILLATTKSSTYTSASMKTDIVPHCVLPIHSRSSPIKGPSATASPET